MKTKILKAAISFAFEPTNDPEHYYAEHAIEIGDIKSAQDATSSFIRRMSQGAYHPESHTRWTHLQPSQDSEGTYLLYDENDQVVGAISEICMVGGPWV